MNFIKKYKNVIIPIGLFFLFFLFLTIFKNTPAFTDEGDNFLGGMMLQQGKLIYSGFASQHLPFMYYIMYIFTIFGVQTVEGFRLCSYALMAFLWVFMYVRYHKSMGIWPLILYPILYVGLMAGMDNLSHTIIAEQIQSPLLAILLLELILFYKKRKIDFSSKILIPITMVASIGIAFVSIIPCFIFVLALFYLDIKFFIEKNKRFQLKEYFLHFLKDYWLILIIGIGLVLIFVLYLLFTGTLGDCYKMAFYLNTEFYSSFNNYSSNPFLTILKCPFVFLKNILIILVQFISFNFTTSNFIFLLVSLGLLWGICVLWKKDKAFSIFLLFYILCMGNRAFLGYHSLPFAGTAILFVLIFLSKISKHVKSVLSILIIIVLFKVSFPFFNELRHLPPLNSSSYYQEIQQLVDLDEPFLDFNVNTTDYVILNRFPPSRLSALVPWYQELYESELMNDLENNKPKVITYNRNTGVWGYFFKDYAKKFDEFILKNYTFSSLKQYWIRNDFVKEAEKILNFEIATLSNDYMNKVPVGPLKDNTIKQFFVAENNFLDYVSFRFLTYGRTNFSLVLFTMRDKNDNIIFQEEFSTSSLIDNQFKLFFIKKPLNKGEDYSFSFQAKNTNELDYVSLAREDELTLKKDWHLEMNGYIQDFNLIMEME